MNNLLRLYLSFLIVFLNESVNFWDCIRIEHGSVMLTMENRSARRKKNSSQCHTVRHKSHMVCPGIQSAPLRCEVGSHNLSRGLFLEEGRMKLKTLQCLF